MPLSRPSHIEAPRTPPTFLINNPRSSLFGTCRCLKFRATLAHRYLLWYLENKMVSSMISLKVDRNDIFYVRFILEGYDGLGNVSTKNPIEGRLAISCPAGNRDVIVEVLRALEEEGVVKEVT
jgi:hypothetical protein